MSIECSDSLKKIYSSYEIGSSVGFGNLTKSLYNNLLNESTPINDKISICMYMLTKVYNYTSIKQNIKDKMVEVLKIGMMTNGKVKDMIYNTVVINNHKDTYIKCEICKFIHTNQIEARNMVYVYKTILFNIHDDTELRNQVVDRLQTLFENPTTSIYDRMIISDVLITSGYSEIGNILIDRVRLQQDENARLLLQMRNGLRYNNDNIINDIFHPNNNVRPGYINNKTIYKDTQSVHNSDINNSVLQACIELINDKQKYSCDNLNEVITRFESLNVTRDVDISLDDKPVNKELEVAFDKTKNNSLKIVYMSLDNIIHDPTFFRVKGGRFTLYNVFASLYDYIIHSPHVTELLYRLIDEMIDMYKYCTTGYMSRLINVIQGYSGDMYNIKLSSYTRTKAVIFKQLQEYIDGDSVLLDKFVEDILSIEDDILKFLNSNMKTYINDEHSGEDVAKSFCMFINVSDTTYKYIDGVIRFDYENYILF